jgi:methionine aminotransferase
MIDIKKVHPGLTYLSSLSTLLNNEIVNLTRESQAFTPHKELVQAATIALRNNYNQCSDLNGYLPLREKISQHVQNEYTHIYNPEKEITITAGTSQAIATAIAAIVRDGDEIILFEPAFYSYSLMITANGGRPVYIPMKQPDFHIDWDEVQKQITSRTKMIIINTPHFPTGAAFSAEDMEKLTKILAGSKIIILSDETFGQIIFEGYEHQSIARFPKLAGRSIIVSSFGKALHVDGWEIGYYLAPAKISEELRKFQHPQILSVNAPLQVALAEFLSEPVDYPDIAKKFEAKRDILVNGLKHSNFVVCPSKGSYFLILNYSSVSDARDQDFCKNLFDNQKIAAMPLSYFYHDLIDQKNICICFAQSDETLFKAVDIFKQL